MNFKILIPLTMIVFVTFKLTAQNPSIVVNDYNPDIKLSNPNKDTLKIDLNNDSINDVIFYLKSPSDGLRLLVEPLHTGCFTTINTWYPSYSLNYDSIYWMTENWIIQKEPDINRTGEVGIKIISNEKNYYAWIKVYFMLYSLNTYWYIDKYAFCTIPDYPLLWGQTELTGVKDIKDQDKIKVSVNGQSKSINIQSKEVIKEISLINSSGRVMQKWRNLKSSKVDIPSGGITGGIYLIRVKTLNNEVFTEKVVL